MAHAVIAIAGSSGLIGSALVSALRATDHRVVRIVRRQPANADEVYWNPDAGDFDWRTLRDVDAVVNLCGVSIGSRTLNITVQPVSDAPGAERLFTWYWPKGTFPMARS